VCPLVAVIPRFIQLSLLLPPLMKLMGQSRRGVSQALEAQRPLVMATPKFIQLFWAPHAAIEPSVLRAAKANIVE
jgi:hypothetical protein